MPLPATQQRIGFFVAGVLFSFVTFYVGYRWPEIFEHVFHPPFNYAWQPSWYRIAGDVLGYLPLVSVAIVVLLRVLYTRAVRWVSYSLGVAVFYSALFVAIFYGEAHSPF